MSEEVKSTSDNTTDDKIQQIVDILTGIEDNVTQLKLENFELKKFQQGFVSSNSELAISDIVKSM
jgi:hypothetical protein